MRKLLAEQEDSLKKQYKTAIDDAMKKIDSLTATVSAMQEKLKEGQCETDKKIKYLEKKINEIQESLEFSQKDLDMVRVMVDECCGLTRFEAELDSLKGQVCYLENQSRRCNIRVDGILETAEKDWNATEEKVKATLVDKLNLREPPRIERAHRTGPKRNRDGSARSKPRTIVCKLYDWKEKEYLIRRIKEIKPTGLYLNEDLAKETVRKWKKQMPKLIEARKQGKLAYFSLDKLIIKNRPR